eukprot:jgi/Botrbrau1/7834/Bobra.9_2s0015.1
MENKTARWEIAVLLFLYLQVAMVPVHVTAVAGDPSAASRSDSAGIAIRPCPHVLCIPPECPREVQVCIKHFPGCSVCCPSCPDSWTEPPPPPPALPPPPPPVTCPEHNRQCAKQCQPGQVPFCWEPHPDGCPCCLGCSGPLNRPPGLPEPFPLPDPLVAAKRVCRNRCRELCYQSPPPQGCQNIFCPAVCDFDLE